MNFNSRNFPAIFIWIYLKFFLYSPKFYIMPKNKLKRYTGAEVAQPKSIAEQLLAGTRIGNLLYGKQETYKDGNNQKRKDEHRAERRTI